MIPITYYVHIACTIGLTPYSEISFGIIIITYSFVIFSYYITYKIKNTIRGELLKIFIYIIDVECQENIIGYKFMQVIVHLCKILRKITRSRKYRSRIDVKISSATGGELEKQLQLVSVASSKSPR